MIIFNQWLIIILTMFIFWAFYLWKRNPGIIDVAWSLVIMMTGIHYLLLEPLGPLQWIMMALLIVWSLRLAGYIFMTRIVPGHIDQRYVQISEGWKTSKALGFLLNYQLQGVLALIIATPFLFISTIGAIDGYVTVGAICVILGLIGEIIADKQLYEFKKSIGHGICNHGLWSCSRHPNYFFEWVIWLGFSIAGMSSEFGWIGLISPLLLLFIMLYITGPITERQSLKRHGERYSEYQKKTAMFFPFIRIIG